MSGAGLHAVITGATSGIGRATTLALLQRGSRVCAVGRNPERLADLGETAGAGERLDLRRADLSDNGDLDVLVEHIVRHHDELNTLIHCAGIISLDPLAQASLEDLDRHYRTNLRAPYALTQGLLDLLEKNGGQVVFVNSTSGTRASAGSGQYAATKHALKAVADSLREEVNDAGIRVISIFPGQTATPMQEDLHRSEGRAYEPERLMQPEDVAGTILSALTLSRSAEVTDVRVRPMMKPPSSGGA
jgi:NADP-dependent 3-hydroxy acid dehydrogenase YdfG